MQVRRGLPGGLALGIPLPLDEVLAVLACTLGLQDAIHRVHVFVVFVVLLVLIAVVLLALVLLALVLLNLHLVLLLDLHLALLLWQVLFRTCRSDGARVLGGHVIEVLDSESSRRSVCGQRTTEGHRP